jgi:hypothetical protein
MQIPDPPAGGPWVERYRGVSVLTGESYVYYESEADDCFSRDVTLTLRSDGRRKYFEWGIVSEIAGSKADVPDWWQTGHVPENSIDVGFEPLPVTVPASRPAPEALSRDEALRWFAAAKERQVNEPVPEPVPDVPLEPAPNTLMHGVPAEERRSFMRWLNGYLRVSWCSRAAGLNSGGHGGCG